MKNDLFKKVNLFLIGVLIILILSSEFSLRQKQFNNAELRVSYLDVGQGDATLINYQGKYQFLIDGGVSGKRLLAKIEEELPMNDKRIDVVVLTHPDKDHMAGFLSLLKGYDVGVLLSNGQQSNTQIYKEFKQALKNRNVKEYFFGEGSFLEIGGVKMNVFNPDLLPGIDDDRNENSVVIRLDFGKNAFLFMGDATIKSEENMMEDSEDLADIDFLKLGHHGSKYSSGEDFLDLTGARFAIISAGKDNRYGHPNEEVLELLNQRNITFFRTDEMGTIRVFCPSVLDECFLKE